MADKVVLTVGTKRGLFMLESNRRRARWKIHGPFLKGWSVTHAMVDTRGRPKLHVAAENFSYSCQTFTADLAGNNLAELGQDGAEITACEKPPIPPKITGKAKEFAEKYGISTAKRVWLIEPGPAKQKKVLYAGTAPAGLFRSEDSGASWEPVNGINRHRTRKDWSPGAGGMALHSIQMDPHDPNKMYAAISAAGAFRSDDGGKKWKPINSCVADYVGAPEESTVGT